MTDQITQYELDELSNLFGVRISVTPEQVNNAPKSIVKQAVQEKLTSTCPMVQQDFTEKQLVAFIMSGVHPASLCTPTPRRNTITGNGGGGNSIWTGYYNEENSVPDQNEWYLTEGWKYQ